MPRYALMIDGKRQQVDADADMPLLYALRGELAHKGPKFGCGLAQCGACTVLMDGVATRSCVLPISSVGNAAIRTLDGLAVNGQPHPVQAAFIAEEAAQCGYCINGWMMTAVAALEKNPRLSNDELKKALSGLKCRCGTHMAITRAVQRARDEMSKRQTATLFVDAMEVQA